MSRLVVSYLWIVGASFMLVASLALGVPWTLFDPIGVEVHEPAGWAELRAAYFGLFGGVGLVLVRGARVPAERQMAVWIALIVVGGFAFGRGVSFVLDGWPNTLARVTWGLEVVGASAAGALLYLGWEDERPG